MFVPNKTNTNRLRERKVFDGMSLRRRLLFLACVSAVAVRVAAQMHPREFTTTVVARADENLAENCTFKMTIPAPNKPVQAVWLTYDRGFDIMKYYDDPAVVTFAQRHEIALVLPTSVRRKIRRRARLAKWIWTCRAVLRDRSTRHWTISANRAGTRRSLKQS